MLFIYKYLTQFSRPILTRLLKIRIKKGKECPVRYVEKTGLPSLERPEGFLIWVHAASVGEVQSALILINKLIDQYDNILVTTGTLTSAQLIEKRLPNGAFHQFYPLDHPQWTNRFLAHWQPNYILWMESEIWPNMLSHVKKRNIPTALINAKMSKDSVKKWSFMPKMIKEMLSVFEKILCQTESDMNNLKALGGENVIVTDNIKYSASRLDVDTNDYTQMINAIKGRTVWLYASSHDGEEAIATNIHINAKKIIPNLLTIIVPRHPERRDNIQAVINNISPRASITARGQDKNTPNNNTDIYLADTIGELGLFYKLCDLTCIGRTFSSDGGGGHNPIEAAQHRCAVLHGPHVQNLQDIFDDMNDANAAIKSISENDLEEKILFYLQNQDERNALINRAALFAQHKENIIDHVLNQIMPSIEKNFKQSRPHAY